MKYFVNVVILFFALVAQLFAQLELWEEENLYTEVEIYLDENENKYAYQVIVNFSTNVIDLPVGDSIASIDDISDIDIKNYFLELDAEYGPIRLEKYFPDTYWGDTVRTNKRTGETVTIIDMSQVFRIHFSELVMIDEIVNDLETLANVDYAESPFYAWALETEPNDPWYVSGDQWNLDSILAKYPWDYTIGSPNVTISINDFYDPNVTILHEDLVDKVDFHFFNFYGGHGSQVASVAGATTNNNLGIASLGWNLRLRLDRNYVLGIQDAINGGANVIKFSWLGQSPTLENMIHNALNQGIICVGGAGNGGNIPFVAYPAAYNFGADGQVIAVSATMINNGREHFAYTWNYSPGTDPIGDSTNAFIDVTAPGVLVPTVSGQWSNYYIYKSGTSFSSPLVAALAGLMLSLNYYDPNFDVPEVYEIITSTADKIKPVYNGFYDYDAIGWNRYVGYGRINAWDALHVAARNPHRVRDLELSVTPESHIKLEWKETYESSHFKIYRALANGFIPDIEDYDLIATINARTPPPNPFPVTSWVDEQTSTILEQYEIYYYITAVLDGNESLPSNHEWMSGSMLRKVSSSQKEIIPEASFIESIYPNPFNPSTTINYFLRENSRVTIKLYDVIGKEVKTIINENVTEGYHSITLNSSDLVSGVYFLYLQNGRFIDTKKVVILK